MHLLTASLRVKQPAQSRYNIKGPVKFNEKKYPL